MEGFMWHNILSPHGEKQNKTKIDNTVDAPGDPNTSHASHMNHRSPDAFPRVSKANRINSNLSRPLNLYVKNTYVIDPRIKKRSAANEVQSNHNQKKDKNVHIMQER